MTDDKNEERLNKINLQVKKNFAEQTEFLRELVRERSVNPGDVAASAEVEVGMAKKIRSKLKDIGISSRYLRCKKKRPNVVAVWGTKKSRKSLALVGHMDTAGGEHDLNDRDFSGDVMGDR